MTTNEYYEEVYSYFDLENDPYNCGALDALTTVNGWNIEAINDFIYITTGYRDLEQLKESEGLS